MDELQELINDLRALARVRDPVERDRRAVELDKRFPSVLRGVRLAAVQEAQEAGMTLSEFARRRGITKQAVDMLKRGYTKPAAAEPAP